jgi:heptosyltransferase-3
MQRFANQPLREHPHLAVFSSSKVGNFVVTIPLLRGLKEKYPGCVLDFFGSEITRDFELHCPYIDFSFPLYSRRPDYPRGPDRCCARTGDPGRPLRLGHQLRRV